MEDLMIKLGDSVSGHIDGKDNVTILHIGKINVVIEGRVNISQDCAGFRSGKILSIYEQP